MKNSVRTMAKIWWIRHITLGFLSFKLWLINIFKREKKQEKDPHEDFGNRAG